MNPAAPILHFGRAIRYAWSGVRILLRTQRSFRIHAALGLLTIAAGAALRLPVAAWCGLTLAIGVVLSAEALNTAVEFLADIVSPAYHPAIKRVKDVAAAAVFFAATAAAVLALFLLGPPIWARLTGR